VSGDGVLTVCEQPRILTINDSRRAAVLFHCNEKDVVPKVSEWP